MFETYQNHQVYIYLKWLYTFWGYPIEQARSQEFAVGGGSCFGGVKLNWNSHLKLEQFCVKIQAGFLLEIRWRQKKKRSSPVLGSSFCDPILFKSRVEV